MVDSVISARLVSLPLTYPQLSNSSIPCTDPAWSIIWSHVSLLLNPTLRRTRSSSAFLRMNVPLAVCSVKTFAAHGSIPGETLPLNFEFDTVGATAIICVFLIPVPTHHSGSPYSSDKARDARSDSILI